MQYWIYSTKHSRDESTKDWGSSKWTADTFLRTRKFYPYQRVSVFSAEDRCILKLFGRQQLVADFKIESGPTTDNKGDSWYKIGDIKEWEYPVKLQSLPNKYKEQLIKRNPVVKVSEKDFFELLGIRNFTQNLRLNYHNRLHLRISELEVESLIDSKNALESKGLEVVERQREFTPGNKIDLLCRDANGDLVVVELKKGKANQTIGQLARYVTDVREHYASATQRVRGLILALDVDEQLVKAARGVDFEVVLCQLVLF